MFAKASINCGSRETSKPFLEDGEGGVVGVGEEEMVHNLKFEEERSMARIRWREMF